MWRKWRNGGKYSRYSATNVSSVILRIQERGIDFQGKRVLNAIATYFLRISKNVSVEINSKPKSNDRFDLKGTVP